MKNLLFILIVTLFFVGCKKESNTPPNNNQNNPTNQSSNYKYFSATIINNQGDTLYKNKVNNGWEDETVIITEEQINVDGLKYVRAITNVSSTNPAAISFSFFDSVAPSPIVTDKRGSEELFMSEFEAHARIYVNGERWVSMPPQHDGNHEISSVTDLGIQNVTLIKTNANHGFPIEATVVSENFHVYQIQGKITGDFNIQGTPSIMDQFTVLYTAMIYLQN